MDQHGEKLFEGEWREDWPTAKGTYAAQFHDLVKARRTCPLADDPRPVNPYFLFRAIEPRLLL